MILTAQTSRAGGGYISYGVEVVDETLVLTASAKGIEITDEILYLGEDG